jgi:hypothetical protein
MLAIMTFPSTIDAQPITAAAVDLLEREAVPPV